MKTRSLLVLIAVISMGCSKEKPQPETTVAHTIPSKVQTMLSYCYSCHSPTAASHDEIIAPPMAAVKMRYMISFSDKESFVEAVSSWSINPDEKSALMRGAVNNFGVMPKAPFSKEDLKVLAAYVYENELPEPTWFREHEQQMHGSGGMGNGMGNGGQ